MEIVLSILATIVAISGGLIVSLKKEKAVLKIKYDTTVEWAEKLSKENLNLKEELSKAQMINTDLVNDLALSCSKISLLEEVKVVGGELDKKQKNGKKRRFYNNKTNPSK